MKFLLLFSLLLSSTAVFSNHGSSKIYQNLHKLKSLKKVLYVAAHPDDENTRALAWFSLHEKAETAYFSLTRGDGGQNLIGNELSEELGVLRTQELLGARSYDGAKQFFSRAVDFGYSKSAEESFEKWGKDEVLHDLVLMIRKFQPDVLVTRFPPDERAGHGHHTASALLAIEAFEKAADPNFLPNQVEEFGTWQATSIYWNTSYWWDENIQTLSEGDPNYLITDIGGYNPLIGMSYNEVGTWARSQHKCQGFGGILERGSRTEYFKHLGGEKLSKSFFEKSTRSWKTIVNQKFENDLDKLIESFDFIHPEKNVPTLLSIYAQLEELPDSYFKSEKIKRCQDIILDCLGLHIELVGDDYSVAPKNSVNFKLNTINRSDVFVQLKDLQIAHGDQVVINDTLLLNVKNTQEISYTGTDLVSNPYWLEAPFINLFKVAESKDFGKAESDPTIVAEVSIQILNSTLVIEVPVTYKWRDPSYGERRRPFISTPAITVNFDQKLTILKAGEQKLIRANVHSFADSLNDELKIVAPEGWTVEPATFSLEFTRKHEEKWIEFILKPSTGAVSGDLHIEDKNGVALYALTEISYDHIPNQVIFKPTKLECKQLDAQIIKGTIAYIKGVEDVVPQAIEQLGFDIELYEVSDLPTLDLSQFQSVVLGIRIYNVHPELFNFQDQLMKYVENGGNLVMQYNTASRSFKDRTFGPIPFELSRNRVTDEEASVTFLQPKHPILNSPNKITEKDFDGWVQERGLYFADNWDEKYTPLFSWADKGENPVLGGLIVTNYGKGQFVYTGISFFRELPNGVMGAYRLFANILSYKN